MTPRASTPWATRDWGRTRSAVARPSRDGLPHLPPKRRLGVPAHPRRTAMPIHVLERSERPVAERPHQGPPHHTRRSRPRPSTALPVTEPGRGRWPGPPCLTCETEPGARPEYLGLTRARDTGAARPLTARASPARHRRSPRSARPAGQHDRPRQGARLLLAGPPPCRRDAMAPNTSGRTIGGETASCSWPPASPRCASRRPTATRDIGDDGDRCAAPAPYLE